MLQDVVEGTADAVTGGWGVGLLVVAGGALLLSRAGRPIAKGAIRGWFAAQDKATELGDQARSFVAESSERVQDLYAEAKAEVRGDEQPQAATA